MNQVRSDGSTRPSTASSAPGAAAVGILVPLTQTGIFNLIGRVPAGVETGNAFNLADHARLEHKKLRALR